MDNETPGEVVVKSNRLIEASYRLTMIETQVILFAITQAREQSVLLSPSSTVTIDAHDFAEQFGLNIDTVYAQLKAASDTMFNRYVYITDIDAKPVKPTKSGKPKPVKPIKSRWLSDINYIDGQGIIEIGFARKVIPYITRLEKHFTSYRLDSVSKMTSLHAIRVYELLTQYTGLGQRKFELSALKNMLGIEGEYKLIHDFKARVLDVAVKQINKHSDIKVAYSQKKNGRVVTDIIFSIQPREAKTSKPAKPAKPKPLQTGLDNVEPAPKSTDPAVLAEREKALAALPGRRKKTTPYDPDFDPTTCHPDDL